LAQKGKTKHDTNWSFDDFVTPQKPTASRTLHRARDVRHWGAGADVVEETPEKMQPQVKGRRDAEAHFGFADDGVSAAEQRKIDQPRGNGQNSGMGLYENNLYNEDGSAPTPGGPPLGNITNFSHRYKDFDPHFNMTDDSPGTAGPPNPDKVDHKKAVRMMESNWSSYDQSPAVKKENNPPATKKAGGERGIVIAGDGMGGRKRPGGGRGWALGDESDEELTTAVPGKKQGTGPAGTGGDFWNF